MSASNVEIQQQNIVEDAPVTMVANGSGKKPRNWCSIISVAIVCGVILLLMIFSVYYIVVTPRIHKSLTSLPVDGYLLIADLKTFPTSRECEKMTTENFEELFTLLISLKGNGTQSFAFYCEKMMTPTGFVEDLLEPLKKFLTDANRVGVSIGIVIHPTQLSNKGFLAAIKSLPFMAFYHYMEVVDSKNNQEIKDFGKDINKELTYIIERSNNIIFDLDEFTKIDEVKPLLSFVNGLVVPVTSLSGAHKNYKYPGNVSLIFMSRKLNLLQNEIKPDPYPNTVAQIVSVTKCAFLSNASALVDGDGIALDGTDDYLTRINKLDSRALQFINYLKDFVKLKNNNKMWDLIEHEVNVVSNVNDQNEAISYSFNISEKNSADFTHLLLLQNIKGSDAKEKTYTLEDFGIPAQSTAQVLISFPQQYSLKAKVNIKTDKITLPEGGSIVIAIYNNTKAKALTDVKDSWPIVEPVKP